MGDFRSKRQDFLLLFPLPIVETSRAVPLSFRLCREVDTGEVEPFNGALQKKKKSGLVHDNAIKKIIILY